MGRDIQPRRYSLAEDRWEEIAPLESIGSLQACSLGDKVYTFSYCEEDNYINVLYNPAASITSQDPPFWLVIDIPQNVLSIRHSVSLAPLNSTEIVVLGGFDGGHLGDVCTFNTITGKGKKEFKVEEWSLSFACWFN